MLTPEQQARVAIDQLLSAAGWAVQDLKAAHVHAARGVAVWELGPNPCHGRIEWKDAQGRTLKAWQEQEAAA
jgi:hypothetical protein